MKQILAILICATLGLALLHATPVTVTTSAIASPKAGGPSYKNSIASSAAIPASGTTAAVAAAPNYRVMWQTQSNGSNYLLLWPDRQLLDYGTGAVSTPYNLYVATTYAEMQAKATALGITNLPADPNAGH
jgi:hypothetical protein